MLPGIARGGGLALCRVADGEDDAGAGAGERRAAARPMPLLAPVTIAVRPVMSGKSEVLEVVMDNNVDADHNDVNVNILR